MRIQALFALATGVLLLPGEAIQAQLVAPGARVRLAVREDRRQAETQFWQRQFVRGELIAVRDDSVFIRLSPATGTLAVARDSITALWISEGPPNRLQSALLHGAMLGLYGSTLYMLRDRGDRRSIVPGVIVGFSLGSFIGARYPPERWLRVESFNRRRRE